MRKFNFVLMGKNFVFSQRIFASNFVSQKLRQTPKLVDSFGKKEDNVSDPLVDRFGRHHTYLRISLTEKCNLRCTYCMPEEGVTLTPSEKLLKTDEIIRIAKVFAANGVEKIRLTGGEPTIRRDLVEIVGELSKIDGIKAVGITSNGIVLGRKLDALIEAGLTHLNLSLDTLDANKYLIMSRRNGFDKVIRLMDRAEIQLPTQLKLNCVVIRGVNDDEIENFVAMTEKRNIDVRFIEYMPFGGNSFESRKMVSYKEMLKKISNCFPEIIRLNDPSNSTSKAYQISTFRGQFGFITSMSEHFCGTCNRLRITADGNLKVCLHGSAEVSLRDKLRAGATDSELIHFIGSALQKKKAQHAGMENLINMTNRPMILIALPFCNFSTTNNSTKLPPEIPFPNSINFIHRSSNYVSRRMFSNSHKVSQSVHPNSESFLLTHLDKRGNANMVDISSKRHTLRIAMARATVQFSEAMFNKIFTPEPHNDGKFENDIYITPKGDIFSAARLAGICAAKRTADLIPLCHHVALSHVEVRFGIESKNSSVSILSRVKCTHGTGVEMEALTACSMAALTIYDMCKALGHDILVSDLRLVGKSGGKSHFGSVEWPSDS